MAFACGAKLAYASRIKPAFRGPNVNPSSASRMAGANSVRHSRDPYSFHIASHAWRLPGVDTAFAPRRFSMYPGVGARYTSELTAFGIRPLELRKRARFDFASKMRIVP